MHSWKKKGEAALICQGASRVQVHAGVPLAPGEKKMKRIHVRAERKSKGGGRRRGRDEAK